MSDEPLGIPALREQLEAMQFRLQSGGEVITPGVDLQQIMASIVQDTGHIPADYLVAAGPGAWSVNRRCLPARTISLPAAWPGIGDC